MPAPGSVLFCGSMSPCHRLRTLRFWPVLDKRLAESPVQGPCHIQEIGLDRCVAITYVDLCAKSDRWPRLDRLLRLTVRLIHFDRIRPMLPEEIEVHRDRMWRRDPEYRVEDVYAAERFIEEVGFCEALTDSRRPGPSLYVAVCGRRDAHMPRNVQKDPESRLAWTIKDEVMRRGKCFYGKVLRGRSTFIAPRLIPFFNAFWGIPRKNGEEGAFGRCAGDSQRSCGRSGRWVRAILREASGIAERARFDKAMTQLQKAMKIIPTDVLVRADVHLHLVHSGGAFSGPTQAECG